jgi:polyisoprenoid-binding protein YceI
MCEMSQWILDPDHSVAAFSIRHMMIANVRGQFNKISGTIHFDPSNLMAASVDLTIDATSIFTGVQKRDDHLKSADFFDIDRYPEITFRSTRIGSVNGNRAKVNGDLTLHGITRQIVVEVEFSGPEQDPFGDGTSIGFTASAAISREDYGLMWNQPMANNGVMVGSEVKLFIDVEADLSSE